MIDLDEDALTAIGEKTPSRATAAAQPNQPGSLAKNSIATGRSRANTATQDCVRYLDSSIRLLENDHRASFTASAKAVAATDWLADLVQRGGEDHGH